MRLKMSSTCSRTRISGWMRPAACSRPGSVTSTAPAGGRLASRLALRSDRAPSISDLSALTAAPNARRSSAGRLLSVCIRAVTDPDLRLRNSSSIAFRSRSVAAAARRAWKCERSVSMEASAIYQKKGGSEDPPFSHLSGTNLRSGQRSLGLRDDLAKRRALGDRHVGEHLAIERDAGGLETPNQLRVGEAVLARRGVDAHHPQAAEVALLVLAPDVGVLRRGIDRLLGLAIQLALGLVKALRTCQQLLP